jgi:hypothetical protein
MLQKTPKKYCIVLKTYAYTYYETLRRQSCRRHFVTIDYSSNNNNLVFFPK